MGLFSKFLAKHANEMRAIGSALDVLTYSGALSARDKAAIQQTVSTVKTAAQNIEESVASFKDTADGITVDKEAVKAAVNELLPSLVASAVAAALAKANKPKRLK